MLTILSPAKTLDFETVYNFQQHTIPECLEDSILLIKELKQKKMKDLSNLMKLSAALSELNFNRFQNWDSNFNLSNSRQSILCFKGGVYVGLDVDSWSDSDLLFSQNSLRILSGLHGVLRPLDLIKPYRLEMGTKLNNLRGCDLYAFWGEKITDSLNESLNNIKSNYLLNLASNEYYSSVLPDQLNASIINVKFLDKKQDVYKIISFFAKKARGAMANFVIKNKINNPADLKSFDGLGYTFSKSRSSDSTLVFIR